MTRGTHVLRPSLTALLLTVSSADVRADNPVDGIVVTGAPGEQRFGVEFARQAASWRALADAAQKSVVVIEGARKEAIKSVVETALGHGEDPLWVVFSGHGSFDGREAKFNLPGEDLAPEELAAWFEGSARQLVVIVSAASSAPFVKALSGKGRTVVTSTRDAYQRSYSRFGQYFVEALGDDASDMDADGAVSLLEAFLTSSAKVGAFYTGEGRLATESALIDDNGDASGVEATAFDGVMFKGEAPGGGRLADGVRAHQLTFLPSPDEIQRGEDWVQERDRLERELLQLRQEKPNMDADVYAAALESLLVEIAEHYGDGG